MSALEQQVKMKDKQIENLKNQIANLQKKVAANKQGQGNMANRLMIFRKSYCSTCPH